MEPEESDVPELIDPELIGIVDVESVPEVEVPAPVGDEVAEGVVVLESVGDVLVGPGGVEVGTVAGPEGVSGPCANAPGAAAASMAATALATAQFRKVFRVCMGEKLLFTNDQGMVPRVGKFCYVIPGKQPKQNTMLSS